MTDDVPLPSSAETTKIARSAAAIQDWLVEHVAAELQVSPDQIRVDQPLAAHGVDSMHAVAIIAKLEDWLGIRFSSDPLEDSPSIESLAQSLSQRGGDEAMLN